MGLTVDRDGCRVAGPGARDVLRHAGVVGRVGQPSGHHDQVALGGHQEVLVGGRINLAAVLEPVDVRCRPTPGWVASDLNLGALGHLLRVGRHLEMLLQVWKEKDKTCGHCKSKDSNP